MAREEGRNQELMEIGSQVKKLSKRKGSSLSTLMMAELCVGLRNTVL
jgi:hypothetical protein